MAVDMFLNLGANIKGESQDKVQGPLGDVDILAWGWGLQNSGSFHGGGGGGTGKASAQDLSFTKYLDTASTGLMIALTKGSHIPECTLLVRKAGEGQKPYLKITMSKVLVTSISTGGSGGEDRLTENVSLHFAEVKVEYFIQDQKGDTKNKGELTWNIAGNDANGKAAA
ncbi:Hcp family type VI secretion system effector [Massilia scottii]|uniref:Hcp family type VI secretion system effector n=1 Tax=Massilia scottii TaxID=3057166 RepID=UPI0027963F02|nr:type VI secretion system tube protein Hcp [Massilia sp. CCM 9029]MDQ1832428.1 type VI secretion system tube protein Hcp [Massilia sp. CCM 9029]